MSTKNLSRTVIEGGRCDHYKREVSDYARSERTASRDFLRLVANDVEAADVIPAPKRKPSQPCFADKIAPVQGFLDSRVGKSWDKTFALICEKFDRRTTPGRHVTNDHILNQIAMNGEHKLPRVWGNYYKYFVDAQGILRKVKKTKRPHVPVSVAPRFTIGQVITWLDKRKIGRMGARLVWFVPSRDADAVRVVFQSHGVRWAPESGSLTYVEIDAFGNVAHDPVTHAVCHSKIPYIQTSVLSSEDEALFLSLSEALQRNLLSYSPRSDAHIFRS